MVAESAKTSPVLSEMVHRLAEAMGAERICPFGSRARGDAEPDSNMRRPQPELY